MEKKKEKVECKHRWHFLREFYFDEWDSLTSLRRFPRGNYAKFICENCGRIKFVKEWEDENN